MTIKAAKRVFRFSIPAKIVVFTATAYVAFFAAKTLMLRLGVDFSALLLGIRFENLFTGFEVAVLAISAAAATHFFFERPLLKLRKTIHKAEDGDILVRAPVLSGDELGELSRAFNQMLSKLTDLSATNIQADQDIMMIQEQLRLKSRLEEKTVQVEQSNKTLELLVRDLSLIYEIGQEVNSIVDLEELYSKITETLKKHLKISELAILVYDDKKLELHVKAAYGFQDQDLIMRTSFRAGEGITGLAAQTGKKIYIKDTTTETRFLHYKGEKPEQASSFLSIPLMYKEEVLGVINFARRGISSFTYQDVKMLSLVASQVALSIANARLYTRTRELSVKDELTGINNRRYFQQMFQMEWKRAIRFKRPLSLVMVDVDYFKQYNDTYGHLQGDMVLKGIGDMLKKNLREVDTVARFGGEEFVLLLPDTDKRGAIAVAEKVRMLVEGHGFLTEEHRETRAVTISAGISTYPDDVEQMDDLIDHADIALYRAKEKGRNCVECYTPPKTGKDEESAPILESDKPLKAEEPRKNILQ